MPSVKNTQHNEYGYFIFIASHLEWDPFTKSPDIIKALAEEHQMWLASENTPFKGMYKKGDRVLLYAAGATARYVMGDAVVAGPIGEATSDDLEVADELGLDGFGQRIPLMDVRIWKDPLPLGPIAGKLKLIKDVRYWGQHFRQAATRISEDDYIFMLKEAQVSPAIKS